MLRAQNRSNLRLANLIPNQIRVFSNTPTNHSTPALLTFTSKQPQFPENDLPLQADIKNLGRLLGRSIKQNDPNVYNIVEKMRLLGRKWRSIDGDPKALEEMVNSVKDYDANTLFNVSRSFTNFLALANSAENHHRLRRLRSVLIKSNYEYGLWPKIDSTGGSIQRLLKEGVSPETIYKTLIEQNVEIVLTAHPTEVNRRTMLRKHRHIKEILEQLDRQDTTLYEKKKLNNDLRAEITSIWESDDLRRTKPTPVDEAKGGLAMVENVLWEAVPSFIRKLDDIIHTELKQRLPLDYSPIKLASWMGGDRDGNPNVTPSATLEVAMLSRWLAASMYKKEIAELRASLSIKPCSEELSKLSDNNREPYRYVLKNLETRLDATLEWSTQSISKDKSQIKHHYEDIGVKPIKSSGELMEPLKVIYRSLVENGMQELADAQLLDLIRRVAAFGIALLPLDIRQESTRHTEALDAVTRYLGIGSYAQWDEETRRSWLQNELSSKRPLLPRGRGLDSFNFSPTVLDTLKTFELLAQLEKDSLGAYVISQCQQASDILAVALLQQDAGVYPPMRVAPLFETLDDLERAPQITEDLFSMAAYRGRINNKQEIMVGYSDSAKDAGRLAASWTLYNSQIDMAKVAENHGIELTFFHGKGGTVGRGGNPALYQAILGHPPKTINGRFRVTEQGEMIAQNFGQVAVAERNFDLFTAGVLTERFVERPEIKQEWKNIMETISQISCKAYRDVIRGEPRFVPYFRSATPELELSDLNVGSRPPKRNPKGGVDSLRAIPWNFAWTQTRLNLPTWLGAGEALKEELKTNPETLKEMYSQWPWFRTLIDLLEMILVKSDTRIAENYDHQLVNDADQKRLGSELRQKLADTASAVLEVSGNPSLQADNALLLRSLAVRNPYVDSLNVIQVELLKRLRDESKVLDPEEKRVLQDALLITINGIANGMRNSG